jgi:hypothetical protein
MTQLVDPQALAQGMHLGQPTFNLQFPGVHRGSTYNQRSLGVASLQ